MNSPTHLPAPRCTSTSTLAQVMLDLDVAAVLTLQQENVSSTGMERVSQHTSTSHGKRKQALQAQKEAKDANTRLSHTQTRKHKPHLAQRVDDEHSDKIARQVMHSSRCRPWHLS